MLAPHEPCLTCVAEHQATDIRLLTDCMIHMTGIERRLAAHVTITCSITVFHL
jgi:hypothetical protein